MKTKILYLSMVAALLSLSGCQFMPDFLLPKAPVPEQFPVDGGNAKAAADISWNEFFQNPELQQVITLALANNRDLKTAALRIEEARALYGIQRADRLPNVNATAGGISTRALLGSNRVEYTSYSVGLGMTAFELDFFGRVKNLSDAALSQFLATEEARRVAQISLIGEVAKVWLNERALAEQAQIAENTLKARRSSYDLVKQRFDAGVANALDLRQSETLVQSAVSATLALKRQHAQSRNALVLLTGSAAKLPEQQATLSMQAITADIGAGLPSDLLTHRPDIRAAERQLRANQANVAAARAAFFPRISLTAGVGVASSSLSNLFDSGSNTWNFTPALTLPIFDAGRNQSNLDLARVRTNIAVANYEKTIQVAFREVADALDARATLAEEITAHEAVRDAQAARLELAQARYKNGVANYLDVLDAERELYTAEQQLLATRLLRLTNAVDLYRSLGGGLKEAGKQ